MKLKLTHVAAAVLAVTAVPVAAQNTADPYATQQEEDDDDFPWGLLGLLGLAGLMGMKRKDDRNDDRGTSGTNR
jgi:hypothetical protein